ncbi:MAG: hypothetical protein Q6373_008420 [Candidatus Sigynarchaeota archaeon]
MPGRESARWLLPLTGQAGTLHYLFIDLHGNFCRDDTSKKKEPSGTEPFPDKSVIARTGTESQADRSSEEEGDGTPFPDAR